MITTGIIGDLRNDPKYKFTATIQIVMDVVQGIAPGPVLTVLRHLTLVYKILKQINHSLNKKEQ